MGADFLANYPSMDGSSLSQREVRRDFSWVERSSPAANPPKPPFLKGVIPIRTVLLTEFHPLDYAKSLHKYSNTKGIK